MSGKPAKRDPRSGLTEDGRFVPVFEGQREPFGPRNAAAVTHGSYSSLRLAPRAAELADEVRATAPLVGAADEPMVRVFGLVLARLEAAAAALDGAPAGKLERLDADVRRWAGSALRFAAELGMSPMSRGRLGVDLSRAEVELERLRDLADARRARERLEERLADEDGGAAA